MEAIGCAMLECLLLVSALFLRNCGGLPTAKARHDSPMGALTAEPAQLSENDSILEEVLGIAQDQLLPKGMPHEPVPPYLAQMFRREASAANRRPSIPEAEYNLLRSYLAVSATASHGHIGCSKFTFNTRSLQSSENLVRADMIFYAKLRPAHATGLAPRVTLRVSVLEANGRKRTMSEKVVTFRRSFNKTRPSQWVRFNILEAVRAWARGFPNLGVQIDVIRNGHLVPCGQRPVHIVRGQARKRIPALLVYSQDAEAQRAHASMAASSPSRRRRSAQGPPPPQVHTCHRQSLQVNLTEYSVFGDLVSPMSLDVGYCNGACQAPLTSLTSHSNHAKIQALLHSKDHTRVPDPCCVPLTFEPVAFMYFDSNGTFVMKFRYDVKVTECACR